MTVPSSNHHLHFIYIAADKFPPFRVDLSVLFGKEIAGRGHIIEWLLQSEKPLKKSYETIWHGCRVIVGPTDTGTSILSRANLHLLNILNDLKIFRLLRENPHHFIIVRDKFISGIAAIFATLVYPTKFIYWLSFPFPEDSLFRAKEGIVKYPFLYKARGHLFQFLLYKILLKYADFIFVQTEQMKRNISIKGIPEKKMAAVPMAVSIKDIPFFGYPAQMHSSEEGPVIVYLGTLDKFRKMDFLLRSFEMVLKQKNDARLYLVGGSVNPSDIAFLNSELTKLHIEHAVTITGFLPQKEAWQYVKKADVCVSPIYPSPVYDVGSPTKLLEYMGMGKASVANDHPEQQVVLSESKAGICVPYDEGEFSEAIIYLIENQVIARKMGINGRKYIEENRNYLQTSIFVEQKLIDVAYGKLKL